MTTVDSMSIDTSVLDPITISQSQAKFVLENKGILDIGSTFTFSILPTQAIFSGCLSFNGFDWLSLFKETQFFLTLIFEL